MTRELLERYHLGTCTEEEKKAVEEWLSSPRYEIDKLLYDATTEEIKKNIWNLLFPTDIKKEQEVSSFYQELTRYAAAACIFIAMFFVGRFSVDTANATTIVDEAPKENLYIFGMNKAMSKIPGKNFIVEFNHTVKLYNESYETKRIQVGDSSFVLEPQQIYFLSGSIERPRLINTKHLPNGHPRKLELTGDFSILRLHID